MTPHRDSRTRSLRARLTWWYAGVLAATLSLFAGLGFVALEQSLIAQLDAALVVAAAQIPPDDDSLGNDAAARRRVEQLVAAGFSIRRIDHAGRVVVAEQLGGRAPPRDEYLAAGVVTREQFDRRWRILTRPIGAGWLQVAQPLDTVQAVLERAGTWLLLAIPLAVGLAALGGTFLAGRALAPIGRLTRAAEALSAGDLTSSVADQAGDDELGRLVRTFELMRQRLSEAFARERRFTADAAHELRTPLTALRGRIEVCVSQPRTAEAYHATLLHLAADVSRLQRLADDLLLLARLDDGELLPTRELVALDLLVASVIDAWRDAAEHSGSVLELVRCDPLVISGDPLQLGRMLVNVLDNALRHGGAPVTVELRAQGAVARLSIHDCGAGIAAEQLARLGQRFARGSSTGSGLGLAIAHEIVRVHHGQIHVASRPGAGTTVVIDVPRVEP